MFVRNVSEEQDCSLRTVYRFNVRYSDIVHCVSREVTLFTERKSLDLHILCQISVNRKARTFRKCFQWKQRRQVVFQVKFVIPI